MFRFFHSRPRLAWMIAGSLLGAVIGYFLIPNFGIASRGFGRGVWGWVFGCCLGTYVGFRVGEWLDRRAQNETRPPQ